jgi:hypothetical protein
LERISGVSYIVGVVGAESEVRFNRMIYRVSRGYACTRTLKKFNFQGLNDFDEKVVLVIYPSSSNAILGKKLHRVVQMFCNSVTELNKEDVRQALALERLRH